MIYEAVASTLPTMRKRLATLQRALDRKTQTEMRSRSGSNRSAELIRDIWAIKAEIEVQERWIEREQADGLPVERASR